MNFEAQINQMADEALVSMAKNPNINLENYSYAMDRIETFRNKYLKSVLVYPNKLEALKDFEARLNFQRAFAVSKTRQMDTGEFTEG